MNSNPGGRKRRLPPRGRFTAGEPARRSDGHDPANAAMTGSERRLRAIIEAEPECVKIVSREGKLLEMNAAGLAMLEASSLAEAQQRPLLNFIAPEHRPAFAELHRQVMNGESGTLEFEVVGLKGTRRRLETHAVPLKDESGGIRELLGVTRDITEHGIMEQALRESEERFRQLAENIREVFWLTDPAKNQMLYISPAYEQIWGRSCESLYRSPRNWIDAIHPDDRARVLEAAQSRQVRGEYDEQYRIVRPDGSIRWIRDQAFPVLDKDGNAYRIAGVAEDITEGKQAEEALKRSQESLSALINSVDGIVWEADAQTLRFTFVSPRAERLLGYPVSRWTQEATFWSDHIHPDDREHAVRYCVQCTADKLDHEFEYRMIATDGRAVWLRDIVTVVVENGRSVKLRGIMVDITERKEQERKIARLSRIYAVLSGINSAIVRIRNRQDMFREACRIAVTEGAFKAAWIATIDQQTLEGTVVAWSGCDESYIEKIRVTARPGAEYSDRPACRAVQEMKPVISNDIATVEGLSALRADLAARGHRSSAAFPLVVGTRAVAVLVLHAAEAGFFDEEEYKLLSELAGDISFNLEYIEKEEKLSYLAYYDALTGLPNSALFHDRLTQFVQAGTRSSAKIATIMINLDRFRNLNDSLGRHNGDMVLKTMGTRLQEVLREPFSVARTAGDTFALAIADLRHEDDVVGLLQERVFPALARRLDLNGTEIRVSAKAGVAVYPDDGQDADTLFTNAEAALTQAKRSGESYLFYAPEMNARVAEKLTLENRLRRALDLEHFVLYYQPKVDAVDHRVVALEALIRWNDPELGLVSPARFIPLMEETGLILDVGRWALAQVARDCRLWVAQGVESPRVAVNVSPIQLRQRDFEDNVVEAARAAQKAGGMLDLEITESAIMENVDAINHKLHTIRELGVEIAVDDFGTGYSSLSHIARLPITTLKIDRSFVAEIARSGENLAIVRSVVSLARALKLQVVAEGVETDEQATLLKGLGCDQLQGYLFSAPVPPGQVAELIRPSGK